MALATLPAVDSWQHPRTLSELRLIRDTPLWLEELADRFEDLVKAPNNGEWPATKRQVHRVAAAVEFDRLVEWVTESPAQGFETPRVICVVDDGDELRMYPTATHELVEAAARNRLVAPCVIPRRWAALYGDLLHHELARIVEQRHREWMVFVLAARAHAADKKRRQRQRSTDWHLAIDTTYERDEWAAEDFGRESWRRAGRRR